VAPGICAVDRRGRAELGEDDVRATLSGAWKERSPRREVSPRRERQERGGGEGGASGELARPFREPRDDDARGAAGERKRIFALAVSSGVAAEETARGVGCAARGARREARLVGRACGSAARERRDAENRAEEKDQEKSARAKRGWVLARSF